MKAGAHALGMPGGDGSLPAVAAARAGGDALRRGGTSSLRAHLPSGASYMQQAEAGEGLALPHPYASAILSCASAGFSDP